MQMCGLAVMVTDVIDEFIVPMILSNDESFEYSIR